MPVLGVGGIFVKSGDPDASKRWYQEVLGLELNSYGGFDFAHADAAKAFGEGARTIFARFESGSDYFEPSAQTFMINLIVSDLDALLERIAASGTDLIGELRALTMAASPG